MAEESFESPLVVVSQRLRETKDNVARQLKIAEDHVRRLQGLKSSLTSRLPEECGIIEQEIEGLKTQLEEKKGALLQQLKLQRGEEVQSVVQSLESIEMATAKTAKAIQSSNELELEANQAKFFASYLSVRNSLEERFIDLLQCIDAPKCEVGDKYVLNSSGVSEAIMAVSLEVQKEEVAISAVSCEAEEEPVNHLNSEVLAVNSLVTSNDPSGDVLSSDEEGERRPQINGLQLEPNMSMSVYVTGVNSPQDFTVQPTGTELISMMEDIGDYYSNNSHPLTETLSVGDFCCALFTEDECWYRAKIIELADGGTRVTVNYVDYGNEETVPISALQPLDSQFCVLPCQAIHCSLENISPALPYPEDWLALTCEWFSSLLLGKTVDVTIKKFASDRVLLDVVLPVEVLRQSLFPNVIGCSDFSEEQSPVVLSSFLKRTGLVSILKSEGSVSHVSSLPPLVIQLNTAREFTCLVSHVTEELRMYVHPVQEDMAHAMTYITEVISGHYSCEDNCIRMSTEDAKCGSFCCVYSEEVECWCRGVMTSTKTNLPGGTLSCLIFHLDYGFSEWTDCSKVFHLVESLCTFPSQVVCCSLSEITAEVCDEKKVLTNPDVKSFSGNPYTCSITRQDVLFECAQFLRTATKEKQLYVIVKQNSLESEDMLLVQDVNCVLPVDMYDTTGDIDVHLNKELVNVATELHKQSKQSGGTNGQGSLQHWNPMEEDYLSKRNIYKIDDSDAGLVLDGYKSTARHCKFHIAGAHCFRGDACPFLHLQKGVSNKQIETAVVHSSSSLKLPVKGDWIVAIATAVMSPTRFYVQLPVGCKSPLSLQDCECVEDPESDFFSMLEEMRDFYSRQVFEERDVILPHTGEVVAVYSEEDGYWYRARVLDTNDDSLSVFFVDYGNVSTILDVNVRSLKPKFIVTPFQAVECFFPDLQVSPKYLTSLQQAREMFTDFIQDKVLMAKVVSVEANGAVGLDVYSSSKDDTVGVNVNKALVDSGVLVKQSFKKISHVKQNGISMRPG